MSTTTPRLRSDLRSEPVEDAQGVLYFDVSDPKSGGVLRLFDFEWLLAQRFDGQRGFDEVARLADKELGVAASSDDVKVYAERLGQLGLLDGVTAQPGRLPGALMATAYLQAAGLVARVEVVPSTGKPAPVSAPVAEKPIEKPVEKAAPPVVVPKTQEVVAPKPLPQVEPVKAPVTPVKPVETPLAAKPIEPVRRTPARDDDDRMGQPVLQLRPPTRATVEPAKPALAEPPAKPVAPVKSTPPIEAAPQPSAPRSNLLEALESLPPPVDAPVAPPAKTELPAALTESPGSLLEQVMAEHKPAAEAKKAPVVPIEVELPAKPVEPPAPVEVAKPAEPPKPVEVAKPVEPPKPVEVAKPVEPPKPVEVAKPVEPPKPVQVAKPVEPPTPAEPSGGGGKWVVIILLLLAIAGAVFWFVVRPMMMPPKLSVKTTGAVLSDVTLSYPSAASVKVSQPTVLKLAAAGKVTMVVPEGKAVSSGTALLELDSLAASQKAQADAQKALDTLKKKLEGGRLKGKAAADLQAKITEKQNKLSDLEAQSKASRLIADKEGTVAKVLVKLGQAVTVGTEALSIMGKGLIAELKVPAADSASLAEGQQIGLTNASKSVSLKGSIRSIAKQDGESLVTLSLPSDAAVKAGDDLLAEKSVLKQVVTLPTVALQEGGRVLVVKDGKAAAVSVTVADQTAESVIVKGLVGGEQVIQTRSPELREGVEVEVTR